MLDLRYRTILSVAIPLMGSSFIQSVVLITDSSFLSRYDTIAFDASGNGGLLYITLFITMIGLSDGAQILMARRIGQQKENLLARIFGTTLFINLLLALGLFLLIQFVLPHVIMSYTVNKDIGLGQIEFIGIRGYAFFFAVISLAINAYFMALGKTVYVLISAGVIAFSNIGLDYLLIFGNHGMPELGLKGAALASTISEGIGMIFLILVLYFSASSKEHKLFSQLRINWTSFKEVLKLGTPIMFQGLIALSTWTVFFAWIEQMGTHELTISQNIRALYFLAFVPIWGFSSTTRTYVSQYVGRKDYASVNIIVRKIQLLTLAFLFIFFHGALFYPEKMVAMINPNIEYLQESTEILRFIFGSVLIYGLGNVYFHTISGSGNTRFTFYVELLSVAVYLLSAYLLIKVYEVSLFWVWSVEYIYFICMGAFSLGYLKFFNWQKKEI
ncbi:MAG: MATE family efflux transporter [Crocinitomicaceae bacterium]|nr:MATE family efflux transporter [Crocinitomicaceae bacterium]